MSNIQPINQESSRKRSFLQTLFPPIFALEEGPYRFLVGLFIVLNFLLTIFLAFVLNIWFDEAYTLNTTGKTLEYAFSQSIGFEEQAPIYFVLLFLWRQINNSIVWARLFSVGCASLALVLTPYLSKRYLSRLHPAWLTAIVAFNPIIVWMALEIRLYAFSTLLGTMLLFLFYEAYLSETPRRWARVFYVLVAIAGLYTHYFIGVLLVVNGVLLLAKEKNSLNALFTYGLDMLFVGICFIPMLQQSIEQLSSRSDNTAITAPPFAINNILGAVKKTIGTFFFYSIPGPTPEQWQGARAGLFCLLFAWAVRWRNSLDREAFRNIASATLILAVFLLGFAVVGKFHFRHATVFFMPAMIALVTILQLPRESIRRRSLVIGTSVFLIWNLICLGVGYSPLAKRGDSHRVASYLMTSEQANQPILVFNSEVEMVLTHYYDGINTLIPLPSKEDFSVFSVDDLVLKQEQQIIDALETYPKSFEEMWLVSDAGVLMGLPTYEESYEILEDFVRENYQVKLDKTFYGARLRLLHPNDAPND